MYDDFEKWVNNILENDIPEGVVNVGQKGPIEVGLKGPI